MTRHHRSLALILLLITPAGAAAQDAMTVLNAAVKAMRLEQVKTIRYTAVGSAFVIGQSFEAGGPYPRMAMKFVREFDLDGFSARQEFINTHHHFDHSNGLRTYAAEGTIIVTHPRNAAFYQKWWSAPAVLTTDRFASSGRTARFETVNDRKVLSDGKRTLETYVVKGTAHADGMLVVYLPAEKLLIEADLFTPPAPEAAAAQSAAH